MASSSKGNFWVLFLVSLLCVIPLPIVLGVMAAKTKLRWLWYLVGALSVMLVAAFAVSAATGSPTKDTAASASTTQSNPAATAMNMTFVLLWVAGLVVMFIVRSRYEEACLRSGRTLDLATPGGQQPARSASSQSHPQSDSAKPATRSTASGGFQLRPKRVAESVPDSVAQSAASAEQLEINSSTVDDLLGMGVSPEASAAIISRRLQLGGFESIVQVQAAAALAPHEWAKIRDRITVNPMGSGWDRPARDGEQDPGPLPGGRIVDI